MAFAHGSNDVANAVGPMAAVISVAKTGVVAQKAALPAWVLLLGGIGIVIGLATFGYKVIATVGRSITELTPSRGFSAEIAAASTVVLASFTGIPISTTHTLVGAILGVGMARGIGAIDLRVVGNIFMSWVVTLPAGGLLAILFFFTFPRTLERFFLLVLFVFPHFFAPDSARKNSRLMYSINYIDIYGTVRTFSNWFR